MRTVRTIAELRSELDGPRQAGRRIGLVPTMGAFHEGHLSLMRQARRDCEIVVVSLFVNPTQFNEAGDLRAYPRDESRDAKLASALGVDYLFPPAVEEIYPGGFATTVSVARLTETLEGAHRGGRHFDGVATVVTKLFAIAGPCVAVFGRKDYQQLLVVRRLARDLHLPVDIVAHPIVREPDGLALSSRNAYLSAEERTRALSISRGLVAAARAHAAGERGRDALESLARSPIASAATSIDYVAARDADTLAALGDCVPDQAVLLVACRMGTTRLIDNMVLGEDPLPS